jgi:hypothetical protein
MMHTGAMGYNDSPMRCVIVVILLLFATPVVAQPAALSEAAVRDLWRHHWSRFASLYIKVGDEYAACGKYRFNFPSSRHVTVEQVLDMTERQRVERTGPIMTRRQTIHIPREDAYAVVNALPRLAIGEYGYIQGATIVEVLSASEMIVDHIQLVDKHAIEHDKAAARNDLERRATGRSSRRAAETQIEWMFQNRDRLIEQQDENDFEDTKLKLVGFDTRGFEEDDHWTGAAERPALGVDAADHGVAIAIVAAEAPPQTESRRRSRSRRRRRSEPDVLIAVQADRLRGRELDEDQFADMLARRGYDREMFVRLVLEQKRQFLDEGDERVVDILEAARPKQQPQTETEDDQ